MTEFSTTKKAVICILIANLVAVILSYFLGPFSPWGKTSEARDTIFDTIRIEKPVPVDSVVVRTEVVELPVKKFVKKVVNDTLMHDSIVYDTFAAEIPITQKIYADSSYKAWVSGYLANLDSLNIYQRTITVKEVRKARRLNLGISAGYGVRRDGKFEPYIGVGITYNFLR